MGYKVRKKRSKFVWAVQYKVRNYCRTKPKLKRQVSKWCFGTYIFFELCNHLFRTYFFRTFSPSHNFFLRKIFIQILFFNKKKMFKKKNFVQIKTDSIQWCQIFQFKILTTKIVYNLRGLPPNVIGIQCVSQAMLYSDFLQRNCFLLNKILWTTFKAT